MLKSVLLVVVVLGAPGLAIAAEPPIFDAHIHYSHDAVSVVPPKEAVAILRKAGLKRALVSSSDDAGTQKLLAEAPDLIIPELRPYRTRGDVGAWVKDDAALRFERGVNRAVAIRFERPEGEVFQLALDLPDAEAVGERRIDVERLARDLAPLDLGQGVERAHVVQAVGKLDEDHAKVLRHRDHHLADVLRLLLLVRAQRDPAQLGDAVDQPSHLRAELALHLLRGQVGVLDGVVQKRGRDRLGVQFQVGQDRGHLEGVVHVVLTRQPALARVGAGRAFVRFPDQLLPLRVEVVGDSQKLGNRQFVPGMKFRGGKRRPIPRARSSVETYGLLK